MESTGKETKKTKTLEEQLKDVKTYSFISIGIGAVSLILGGIALYFSTSKAKKNESK